MTRAAHTSGSKTSSPSDDPSSGNDTDEAGTFAAATPEHATEGEPGEPVASHLNLVVVGHVDHGKSTLIGRLLFDTKSVAEGKAEQIAAACQAEGMEFEYAFLLDALLEEQAQNITMDTTRVPFRTARRSFTIIDAPGHKEFLKNMITGAASAEAAVLLVDAKEGLREQTRRHGYLLSLLGLKQVVVAVNKMDLVDYSAEAFAAIQGEITDFLARLHVRPRQVIPISAKHGEGILRRSDKMPWYHGHGLLETLENFAPAVTHTHAPLRLIVQDIYRFDARRIVAGFVESGQIAAGDPIVFHPGGKQTRVRTIETWPAAADAGGQNAEKLKRRNADMITADGRTDGTISSGSAIALTLEDELFIERGHVGATPHHAPITAREFKGRVFWLHDDPLRIGDTVPLRIGTQHVHVRLVQINGVLDVQTLERNETPVNVVHRHEVAEVKLRAHRPLVFDPVSRLAATGRFVLLRGNRIGGGGVIDDVIHEDNPGQNLPVGPKARARLLGHRGGVIWLTGLSGSGKTTLAVAAEQELFRAGVLTVVLDGDVLRAGLCAGLGFDEADRKENIRRTAEAALLMAEAGAIVITALISPYRADRALGAERCRTREVPFAEVYVNAPLEECERRDPKHLYQRVRKGKIPAFTGISSPYEEPQQPALEVRTDLETVEESVGKLVQLALALASKS